MKGRVAVISDLSTEFQRLINSGRSRQLRTHLEYASLTMVSDVGRTASRSESLFSPASVTQNTSGVNPLKCSAYFLR